MILCHVFFIWYLGLKTHDICTFSPRIFGCR